MQCSTDMCGHLVSLFFLVVPHRKYITTKLNLQNECITAKSSLVICQCFCEISVQQSTRDITSQESSVNIAFIVTFTGLFCETHNCSAFKTFSLEFSWNKFWHVTEVGGRYKPLESTFKEVSFRKQTKETIYASWDRKEREIVRENIHLLQTFWFFSGFIIKTACTFSCTWTDCFAQLHPSFSDLHAATTLARIGQKTDHSLFLWRHWKDSAKTPNTLPICQHFRERLVCFSTLEEATPTHQFEQTFCPAALSLRLRLEILWDCLLALLTHT